MSNIVKKARIIQDKIEYRRSINKQLKKQYYRIVLQTTDRLLPPIKSLIKWRMFFIVAGSLCFLAPTFHVVFLYDTWNYTPSIDNIFFNIETGQFEYKFEENIKGIIIELIPVLSGSLAIILYGFGATVDYAIYKRFNCKNIIMW